MGKQAALKSVTETNCYFKDGRLAGRRMDGPARTGYKQPTRQAAAKAKAAITTTTLAV